MVAPPSPGADWFHSDVRQRWDKRERDRPTPLEAGRNGNIYPPALTLFTVQQLPGEEACELRAPRRRRGVTSSRS